jgi:anti-sigma B factor antagonist
MTASLHALPIKVGSMNNSPFRISVAQQSGTWIVSLSGEVDYAASLELLPQLADIINHCDSDLLFDLGGVTLIDSEGIKAILVARQGMRLKNREVRVVNCSHVAQRVLKLVGVDEALGAKRD